MYTRNQIGGIMKPGEEHLILLKIINKKSCNYKVKNKIFNNYLNILFI